jgi:hypothetical protein
MPALAPPRTRLSASFVLVGALLVGLVGATPARVLATPVDADEDGNPDETFAIRAGADLGFGAIERGDYVLVDATIYARVWNIRADVWAPLRFLTDGFTFVTEDWSQPRDFARIFRCVRLDVGDYEQPEDRFDPTCEAYGQRAGRGLHGRTYFSLRVAPLQGVSLGHETLVFNFRSQRDMARPQLGAVADLVVSDWLQAEAYLDDVTNPGVMVGRAILRPSILLTGDSWDETPDDFVIGVTYAGDFQAPLYRQTAFGRPLVDPQTGDARFTRDALFAIGVDTHYTYYWGLGDRDAPQIGFMVYGDFNVFPEITDAYGFHGGLRFTYRHQGWQVFLGGEYRLTGNRYLPEYFDTEYVSRAQQFLLTPELRGLPGLDPYVTKYGYMLSRPDGFFHSGQIYGNVVIPIPLDDRGNYAPLPFGFFLEDADGPANASVSLSAGPFRFDQLVVAGQYLRRNFDDWSQMFALEGTLIRLLGRLYLGPSNAAPGSFDEILSHIHLDARFDRRWFQTAQGDLAETNDFALTVGFTAGT